MFQPSDAVLAEFVGAKETKVRPLVVISNPTLSSASPRLNRRIANDAIEGRQHTDRLHIARLASSRFASTQCFSCLPRHGSR